MGEAAGSIQMPRYKCHKTVYALKIAGVVQYHNGGARLEFVDGGYAGIDVTGEYLQRHQPKEGGYYVVYDDGYASFSPAKAFEDGYTRI